MPIALREFEEWRSNLQKIRATTVVGGMEWVAYVCFHFLQLFSVSYWVMPTLVRIDLYAVIKVVLLAISVWIPRDYLPVISWIAAYLLFELYVAILNIVFVGKLPGVEPISSVERSILLLFFNVLQVILTFAIFYRWLLSLDPTVAIVNSILVFGTVGHPMTADTYRGGELVAVQIVLDFLLVAIFLAAIIGRVKSFDGRT